MSRPYRISQITAKAAAAFAWHHQRLLSIHDDNFECGGGGWGAISICDVDLPTDSLLDAMRCDTTPPRAGGRGETIGPRLHW